jgi:hypothetical protein
MSKVLKLLVTEQIRGDIVLKAWETNIVENKKIVKEIKYDCEGIFDSLDKKALGLEINDFSGLLGQINILKQQLYYKESLQEVQAEISQLSEINTNQIDRWLIQPNLNLQVIRFADKGFED